jgi:superkiller protein 3
LRSSPSDVHAWIGLGESYANSGRHSAALKSFARAEALNPGNWFAKYILGNVQKDILEFGLACQTFREILLDNPNEFSVSLSLAQTLLTWAYACFRTGEFSKSIDVAVEGVMVAQGLVKKREELSEAWKLIGDASYLGSLVQVDGSKGLLEIAADVLDMSSEVETLLDDDCKEDGAEVKKRLLHCNVAAMKKVVTLTEGDRLAHSAVFFNLGLAKYRLATMETDVTTSTSVRPILDCFKKAIQSEPRNFEYWNALGVVTAGPLPSVAEKAFSRSLQINERVLSLCASLIIECNSMDEFGNHVSNTRRRRVSCAGIFTKSSE